MNKSYEIASRPARLPFVGAWRQHGETVTYLAVGLVVALLASLVLIAAEIHFGVGQSLSEIEATLAGAPFY